MASFKTQNGKTVKDGDRVSLRLRHGEQDVLNDQGQQAGYYERPLEGTVRSYEHVDRVLDADGYAIDKKVRVVWEITQGDQSVVGFLPENVLTLDE